MVPFILVVGPSGVGKTTLLDKLKKDLGLREVQSVTTRKRRPTDTDETYRFVTPEEFKAMDLVETVFYSGNHYGTPKDEMAVADILVAEPSGCLAIQRYCAGIGRKCYTLGLYAGKAIRAERMFQRGDNMADIMRRIDNDELTFDHLESFCDVIACGFSMEESYPIVKNIVEQWRETK